MKRSLKAIRLLSTILATAACVLANQSAYAQQPMRKPGGRGGAKVLSRQLLPMFQLVKSAHFAVKDLKSPICTFMRGELVELPKGFAGDPNTRMLTYCTYGYRKGGLVRVYETPAFKNRTAKEWMDIISSNGLVHDSFGSPKFCVGGFTAGGITFIVTSLDQRLLQDAIATLK